MTTSAPIVPVQSSAPAFFSAGGASNTAQITLQGVTPGNSILVEISARGTNFAQFSCSVADSTVGPEGTISGTYTPAVQNDFFDSTGGVNCFQAEVHYLHGHAGGTCTITVTNAAGSFNCWGFVVAHEVNGLAQIAPSSTNTNQAPTGSTTPTAGSVTAKTASALTVAVVVMLDNSNPANFVDPPTGASLFTRIAANFNGAAQQVVGAADYLNAFVGPGSNPAAQNPSWAPFPDGGIWAAAVAVFEANIIGTPTPLLRPKRHRQGGLAMLLNIKEWF